VKGEALRRDDSKVKEGGTQGSIRIRVYMRGERVVVLMCKKMFGNKFTLKEGINFGLSASNPLRMWRRAGNSHCSLRWEKTHLKRKREKRGKPPGLHELGLGKSWTEVYSEEQVMEEKR
jgi:hypothetical protein